MFIQEHQNEIGWILEHSGGNLNVFNRYVLTGIDSKPDVYLCLMYDVLYSDLEKFLKSEDVGGLSVSSWIAKLISTYGKELVDQVITQDEKTIQKKLINIINFALDKIYKSDTICIVFVRDTNSSIPDIIYATLQVEYEIVDVENSIDSEKQNISCITIKKKTTNEEETKL